jgi:RNA polymerase sigma-70 factor (ECF subfamily)
MTDKEILDLFQIPTKSEQAFNLLLKRYQQKLYFLVRRMVLSHDDADDIMQNVWIKIWKNLANFKQESQLYTWLYRIASNETFTFLEEKKKKATTRFESHNDENEIFDSSILLKADAYFDGDEIQLKLEQAIQQLPDKQKMVFQLKYYEEMKYEEMSETLGTSVGALKASYHHAIKKIEVFLKTD